MDPMGGCHLCRKSVKSHGEPAGRLFGPREKPPWQSRKLGFYIKPFIPRRVGRSLCFQTPWVWMYDWTPKTIPSKHRSFWRGMTGRLGKERSRFFELVSREEWSSPFLVSGHQIDPLGLPLKVCWQMQNSMKSSRVFIRQIGGWMWWKKRKGFPFSQILIQMEWMSTNYCSN